MPFSRPYIGYDLPIPTNIIAALAAETNGNIGAERLVQSTPGSPQDRRPNSFEVIGSAESLVGRVS